MGVVVRRCIDILTIIINFPYSTCISSFLGSNSPTFLFIFKMFFRVLIIMLPLFDFCLIQTACHMDTAPPYLIEEGSKFNDRAAGQNSNRVLAINIV